MARTPCSLPALPVPCLGARARSRDPEAKRRRILDAATRLFSEAGYEATSTGQIAREAGVAEGSVFHHFGNKQGLLAAVATQHGEEVAAAMFEGMRPGDPPDVRSMVTRVFDKAEKSGRLAEVLAMASLPGNWSCGLSASHEVIVEALTRVMTEWRDRGFLRSAHPAITAQLSVQLVSGALHAAFLLGDGARKGDYLDEVVRMLEAGLTAEGRSGPAA